MGKNIAAGCIILLVVITLAWWAFGCTSHREVVETRAVAVSHEPDIWIYTNTEWLAHWYANRSASDQVGPPREGFVIMATAYDVAGRVKSSWPDHHPGSAIAVANAFESLGWKISLGIEHPPFEEYDDWFSESKWNAISLLAEPMMDWCAARDQAFHFDIEPYKLRGQRYPEADNLENDLVRYADASRAFTSALVERGVALVVQQAHLSHGPIHVWRAALGRDRFIVADSGIKYLTYDRDLNLIRTANDVAAEAWSRAGFTRWPTVQAFALHRRDVLSIALEGAPAATVFFSAVEGAPTRENYHRYGGSDWAKPLVERFESWQGAE